MIGREELHFAAKWALRLDPEEQGAVLNWAAAPIVAEHALRLPGCVQQLDALADAYPPSRGLRNGYLGSYWLENEVFVPEAACGKHAYLELDAAPYAHCFVNSRHAGHTEDPLSSSRIEVHGLLAYGCMNRITLLVREQDVGLLGGFRFDGLNWSGVYREPKLVFVPRCHVAQAYIQSNEMDCAKISICVRNASSLPVEDWLEVRLDGALCARARVALLPGSTIQRTETLDVRGVSRWSPEEPSLHELRITLGEDALSLRTGFRCIASGEDRLWLDGKPLFLFGVGQEYFSPTIAPLTDSVLIRRRFRLMRQAGFNFCRYHTYQPTQEELTIADEEGMLLSSEVSVISNFNLTTPFEHGLTALARHIQATASHPSLMAYCLGNEGAQLMALDPVQRDRAVQGYALIKRHTASQLAMICFGIQGEVPGVPNDLVTPHLWDADFTGSYGALCEIPFESLGAMQIEGPLALHEYGKFGVWPDLQELGEYPQEGYLPFSSSEVQATLAQLHLTDRQDEIVRNARLLSERCTRIAVEAARRQTRLRGYVLWTFFRMGHRNAGMAGDMALHADRCAQVLAMSQAPVALQISCDFRGRCLQAGAPFGVDVQLSNYGCMPLESTQIKWQFCIDGMPGMTGEMHAEADVGESKAAGRLALVCPLSSGASKARLTLALVATGWENSWDFWVFPPEERKALADVVTDFADSGLARRFASAFEAESIAASGSMLRGCRSWINRDDRETLALMPRRLLVTDHLCATARDCLNQGMQVLLLGDMPTEWCSPPLYSGTGEADTGRFFSSFRAGWDRGVLATLVEDCDLLGDFPHTGFCDLQFYQLLQGTPSICIEAMRAEFPDARAVIRSLVKIPMPLQEGAVLQDVNAVKAQTQSNNKAFFAREQVYLADCSVGDGRLVACSLPLIDCLEGRYLLRLLLEALTQS